MTPRKADPKTASSTKARTCSICGRPAVAKWRTFCSQRCADVDLSRWLEGAYRIPTEEAPTSADESATTDQK